MDVLLLQNVGRILAGELCRQNQEKLLCLAEKLQTKKGPD